MLRFIHTSDLHLGKRFGQFPEELRGRLTEARHKSVETLADIARAQGADLILVAGDIFDTGTPSPAVIRQSLRSMGDDPAIKWVLLPGNHDSLSSDELWRRVMRERPENVVLALESKPVEIAEDVLLLPAPCMNRRPGRDLTQWMGTAQLPPDSLQIGLAHGAVQSFGEDGAADVIAPDRAELDGLDYLALGDWHGQRKITARTWYSGAPEPDRFKHDMPGQVLAVAIEGRGAVPDVTPVETGHFCWSSVILQILPDEDAAMRLAAMLPEAARRRDALVRIKPEGRIRLPERLRLEEYIKDAAPDFAWMEIITENLKNEYVIEDLDLIDKAGVLRKAADALLADARLDADPHGPAATALSLLYSFAEENS